eukprot:4417753-Amphidinium_carterae.1
MMRSTYTNQKAKHSAIRSAVLVADGLDMIIWGKEGDTARTASIGEPSSTTTMTRGESPGTQKMASRSTRLAAWLNTPAGDHSQPS